ncbi:MAG TPA: ABC transporter permease [Gemmatimonadaceae bacterium]|nr:ABC transporter permease [Gemmatimonadaceae bacterium]
MRRPSGAPPPAPDHVPGERCYRLLLHLYPASFRAQFGEEMVDFFRERWRAERTRSWRGALAVWLHALLDTVATAPLERADALARSIGARREGARTITPTPHARDDEMLWSIRQDVRYALRGMRRQPAFTAVILATLALGLGANVAIFSIVHGVLLRPLPYAAPERIVQLAQIAPYGSVSEPEFMDYRRDAHSFERLAAYTTRDANLTGGQEPERVQIARISDGFFSILGVPPQLGRAFTSDDDVRHHPPVAEISYGLWQRRFGGDPHVVGSTIRLNGQAITVVGVMPRHFDYPSPNVTVWVPLRLDPDSLWTRNNHYLQLIGRLAPSATVSSASTEVNTMDRRWMHEYPETYFPTSPLGATVTPIRDALFGSTRPYLIALLGAVGFVLLIACVNVANLLLARGESRRKELAIRTALGAARRRLVRQALTESVLFAVLGGALGLLVAWWGTRAMVALAPSSIPRLDEVHTDMVVLAFAVAVSLVTGVLFGFIPAMRDTRNESADALKDGGKTSAHTSGARRTGGVLVVAEVALAVIMLVGAGLMLRSLWTLQAVDLGFDPSHVLTMRLSLPPNDYTPARAVQYFGDLTNRVRAMPGVRAAAAAGWLPIDGGGGRWSIFVDGRVVKSISEAPAPEPEQVTPDYFRAMGMTMVRGRAFTEADRADAPMVAVVNEAMAKQLWPGENPIGHTIKMFNDEAPWATVVGVVKDTRSDGIQAEVPPTMFFPYAQAGKSAYYTPFTMSLVVRTAGDPFAVAGAVRAAVKALDPNVPISSVQSMDQVVAASIAGRHFSTMLLGAFAALALVLAGIGIYGVIAYGVSQRRYEIGLRMALGAQRGSVLALVMMQGMRLTLIGLAIGVVGALAISRALRSLLVGVTPIDLPTLGVAAVALVGIAAIACVLPARRAMAVMPTDALRGG